MANNQKSIEKAFYSDGYQLGMKVDPFDINKEVLFRSISEMYDSIDGLIDSLTEFAKTQQQSIDCKKGCEWCCHQPVFALDYEIEYLNDFINCNFDEETKREIKQRAEQKNQKLGMLSESELLNSKHPCALLKNGACIAYAARPMACRIYLSSDVNSCLNFYHQPDDDLNYPKLIELTLRCGQMMNEGFKAALKINGKGCREFRIEEKILEPGHGLSQVRAS
jgi:Fe-S-cluster containining protein